MQSSSKAPDSMAVDLRALVQVLRENLWMIAGCVAAGVIVAGAVIVRSPRIYAANAVVQVEHDDRQVVKLQESRREDGRQDEELKTIEQNLTSPGLLLRLVHNNELLENPQFLPEIERPISDTRLQSILSERISAHIRRGTHLIDIAVEDPSPALAQQMAQLLVTEFIRQSVDARAETASVASRFLGEEAERLRAKLARSEQALQSYREQNQAVSLEEKQNIVVEKLRELSAKVTATKTDRMRLESERVQVAGLAKLSPDELLAVPGIASVPAVVDAKKSVAEKEALLAILLQRYKPAHPRYIAAESELRELRQNLDRAAMKASVLLENSYAAAVINEQALEAALREQEKVALELNKVAIPYNVLVREAESDRALYEFVLRRLKESDVSKGASDTMITVVSRPLLPERPVKPSRVRLLLIGLAGGLAVGGGLSFARRTFDPSLKTVDEAEQRLGLPALGVIPKSGAASPAAISLLHEPQSMTAESFRGLRTSLSMLNHGIERKSVLFTSAVASEGKSFCAINCAIAFAQLGQKILLIDADLRRPTAGGILLDQASHRGLAELLAGEIVLREAIQPTAIKNLSVITAGRRGANPAELLANGGFVGVLRDAGLQFDRIVIDTAPVNAVSDSLLLAKDAQAVCLVVLAGETPAETISLAAKKLADVGAAATGFIFNRVSSRTDRRYYDHRYCKAGYGETGKS